ncbi:Puromycin-sensitive aminopeptidase [Porphyridium purpureum]|uniref:Puromycin-sensitive aminopeptidase n=1 Tax=Porphyridium purpureum TaxID=35688 RepID=A0A5J4YQX4_PORPP|nr:Puromycin-sensitive aminopeptidase [Porphyridium purpureum]|eukprot:POR2995..scf222_8
MCSRVEEENEVEGGSLAGFDMFAFNTSSVGAAVAAAGALAHKSTRVCGLRALGARYIPQHVSRGVQRRSLFRMMSAEAATATLETQKAMPAVKLLADYTPPPVMVDNIDMEVQLHETKTVVTSVLTCRARPGVSVLELDMDSSMVINTGSGISINGAPAADVSVSAENSKLCIPIPGDVSSAGASFQVQTKVVVNPEANKALEGLYMSGGNFCTQCEAEGFRKITPFPDRPDVMSTYSTVIIADKEKYPVLLGNGNLVESGACENDTTRHFAKYVDPWPKPCYLFALVAGKLVYLKDFFTTMSGRKVALRIYVRDGDIPKCKHAMESLKRSMTWDEEKYGREYDLDIFNVVAVADFNMGAMENKSLNIFNSKYVLASTETATDADFISIEGIIGHEYFHNWTGNRVTCRDWFQLTLKEGLTVFRDQEFSADMGSRAVTRIGNVMRLRSAQFPQDAGPMAHPTRPESYIEINNFYTATVYQKGAEVIRMLYTILGPDGFRRGTDRYFELFDGQAVTCEDWIRALAEANPDKDLEQFKLWYSQAGTPKVKAVVTEGGAGSNTMTVHFEQTIPPTPGQAEKLPMHIPIAMGVLGPDGKPVAFRVGSADGEPVMETVLDLKAKQQTLVLYDVPSGSVASLLRGFSAPVDLEYVGITTSQLCFIMAHDTDSFNTYEASQQLLTQAILENVKRAQAGESMVELDEQIVDAMKLNLADSSLDPMLRAYVLSVPSEGTLFEKVELADPIATYRARKFVKEQLASRLESTLRKVMADLEPKLGGEYSLDPTAMGNRALFNASLELVATMNAQEDLQLCLRRVENATNMTDALAALSILARKDCEESTVAVSLFYKKWSHDYLVVDKWLRIQATSAGANALDVVKQLVSHPAFDISNPNNVYAVLGGFAMGNPYGWHAAEPKGAAYQFIAEQVVRIDKMNPQVASRIVSCFTRWRKFTEPYQSLMKAQLEFIRSSPGISNDVYEIVEKSLA